MIKRLQSIGLRQKLMLLILISGGFAALFFSFVWKQIDIAWNIFQNVPPFYFNEAELVETLTEIAPNYSLPEYDDGKNLIGDISGFFAPVDEYTNVAVYGEEDGYYRASIFPHIFDNIIAGSILDNGTSRITNYEDSYDSKDHWYTMQFQNETASVIIRSYHNASFVYPYLIFTIALSLLTFFLPIFFYLNQRVRHILLLKKEILLMSSGDLGHCVPSCGKDELGTLSLELDSLRLALASNIEKERKSRQANQDLITAMSHDLRTPLTILKGYLEVTRLKKEDSMLVDDYLDRCIKKADDIQEMTDKMFEYAFVFEEAETIETEKIPVSFLTGCLQENKDFIQLAGFKTEMSHLPANGIVYGEKSMLKRIFNNLFSNILKYGDKSIPLQIECNIQAQHIFFRIANGVKEDTSHIASNGIGLRSVKKMLSLHNGSFSCTQDGNIYTVSFSLPLETE